MHPIVMIAADKDPAIGKAVADLEAAGFEVRVLNSSTAKLVDFLGALAGSDEDAAGDDTDADVEAAKAEPAAPTAPAKATPSAAEEPEDENDPLAPSKMEAMVNDESVQVQIVDGASIVLHPSAAQYGSRTTYALNESVFSFWPSAIGNEPITGGVELCINEQERGSLTLVTFGEAMEIPTLKIGREWMKEASYPKHHSWAVLPATQAIFDKNKVTPDEVDKELGSGSRKGSVMIVQRTTDAYPNPKTSILMMPGADNKIGDSSPAHHDQTFGRLGTFTVLGHLKKDGDEWKLTSEKKIPGLETPEQIKKFKAGVYVFK